MKLEKFENLMVWFRVVCKFIRNEKSYGDILLSENSSPMSEATDLSELNDWGHIGVINMVTSCLEVD